MRSLRTPKSAFIKLLTIIWIFDPDPSTVQLAVMKACHSTLVPKDFTEHQRQLPAKPCHVSIHWIALVENFWMSTHLPGFQSFLRFFATF